MISGSRRHSEAADERRQVKPEDEAGPGSEPDTERRDTVSTRHAEACRVTRSRAQSFECHEQGKRKEGSEDEANAKAKSSEKEEAGDGINGD